MNAGVAAAARGPFAYLLQTQTGQWLVLGLGAFTVFPDKCEEIVRPLLRSLILGFPNVPMAGEFASLANRGGKNHNNNNNNASQAPIVIQTSSGGSGSLTEKLTGQLVTYVASAAGVWVTYTVLTHYLPDWAKEMLPVTRKVFDKAVHNLGMGIVNCSEQIMTLIRKHDETHGELMEAREDIQSVQNAVGRCEDALDDASKTNNKSAKGIKLLVRAVATMVPGNLNIAEELNLYAKEIDIDPNERGEYLNAQQRNNSNSEMYHVGSDAYNSTESHSQSVNNSRHGHGHGHGNGQGGVRASGSGRGKMFSPAAPRTPMTRSISEPDDISEISADGPKGKVVMMDQSGDVSYMSMFSPVNGVSGKKGMLPNSTLNMQKRIETLLTHGRVM